MCKARERPNSGCRGAKIWCRLSRAAQDELAQQHVIGSAELPNSNGQRTDAQKTDQKHTNMYDGAEQKVEAANNGVVLSMNGCAVSLCSMLCSFSFFELGTPWRHTHTFWKLVMCCVRWSPYARMYVSFCARDLHVSICRRVPFTAQIAGIAVGRTARVWCALECSYDVMTPK